MSQTAVYMELAGTQCGEPCRKRWWWFFQSCPT